MGVAADKSVFENVKDVYSVNLPSRLDKIADGVVMAVRPPIRAVGLSLKAPTRIKLPEKELPDAEPSSLLELKPMFSPKYAGKVMITASAETLLGKRHGRSVSKKRQKEENPSLGQIDEVLARLCRSKLWRLKKHIEEINTNFCKKLVERSTVIELSQRFVSRSRLCFSVGLSDSKSEKRMVIAD